LSSDPRSWGHHGPKRSVRSRHGASARGFQSWHSVAPWLLRCSMRLSDEIILDIERREAATLGARKYQDFKRTLRALVDSLTQHADTEDSTTR
jgi:hypothetical protein